MWTTTPIPPWTRANRFPSIICQRHRNQPRPAMILKTSQNTDNAKAFMDFLLSDEGQQLVCDAYPASRKNRYHYG
ncbi:MAG: extracellular solute-binding protein [Eisenbergiella sp.]